MIDYDKIVNEFFWQIRDENSLEGTFQQYTATVEIQGPYGSGSLLIKRYGTIVHYETGRMAGQVYRAASALAESRQVKFRQQQRAAFRSAFGVK